MPRCCAPCSQIGPGLLIGCTADPILLAGMANISLPELAAAVSNAGGMGVIGGAFISPDTLRAHLKQLKSLLRDPSLPFGVDLLLPQVGGSARATNKDYTRGTLGELVDIMIEEGVSLFVCAVRTCRPCASVPSAAPADAWTILTGWHSANPGRRATARSWDYGHEHGWLASARAEGLGLWSRCRLRARHGGWRAHRRCCYDSSHPAGKMTLLCSLHFELNCAPGLPYLILMGADTRQCVDLCKGHRSPLTGQPVAVLGAGGIYDGRGLAAALALGAAAVWVGTRFVAAEEAAVGPRHQQAVVNTSSDDTVRTTIFSGRPMRVMKNDYIMEWETKRQHERDALLAEGKRPYKNDLTVNEEAGTPLDFLATYPNILGQASGGIHEVLPAETIVHDMVQGAIDVIRAQSALLGATANL